MDLVSVEEVLPADRAVLDRWRKGDAWLAGGTWLFSEPQPQVRRLVDLSAFDWPALSVRDDGLEIAATCTLAQLARWPGREDWPAAGLIGDCCRALLGSFKVWNAATVGGNLCLALPAGSMTSLAVALDGRLTLWAPGGKTRVVRALDFVLGPGRTALGPGELLRSVLLPATALRAETAFRQLSLSPLGRSAAVVIGRRSPSEGELVITFTASVPRPVELHFAAAPTAEEVREALDRARLRYHDDVHGDPDWREHLSRMFAEEVRAQLQEDG
jgi:CO/xanthine dehydrogenase FAD-binding subunit